MQYNRLEENMNAEWDAIQDFYLWPKKYSRNCLAWERICEFLKYEWKQIKEVSEWHRKFISPNYAKFDNVCYYTVPIEELSASWKSALATYEEYTYVGLSALPNTLSSPLIAIIPTTSKIPDYYKLIEIQKPRREFVKNSRKGTYPILLMEDWNYVKDKCEYVYRKVPYEKGIVTKIFNENLNNEKTLVDSFQSPLFSSPFSIGLSGGISLASFSNPSGFGKEVMNVLELMAPPEFRSSVPPRKLMIGGDFEDLTGIKFHLADRPETTRNVIYKSFPNSYDGLQNDLSKRWKFSGELSMLSSIEASAGSQNQIIKQLLLNFGNSEVTIPTKLEDILDKKTIHEIKNDISEDVWLQTVESRYVNPNITDGMHKKHLEISALLQKDYDVQLSELVSSDNSRKYLILSMMPDARRNLFRLGQSFARAEGKDQLDENHLKSARNLILDNLTNFKKSERLEIMLNVKTQKYQNERFSYVQTNLLANPWSSVTDLFRYIKSVSSGTFSDLLDLQTFLDWLEKKGYVIVNQSRKYAWFETLMR